jgi:hypothetical protein
VVRDNHVVGERDEQRGYIRLPLVKTVLIDGANRTRRLAVHEAGEQTEVLILPTYKASNASRSAVVVFVLVIIASSMVCVGLLSVGAFK